MARGGWLQTLRWGVLSIRSGVSHAVGPIVAVEGADPGARAATLARALLLAAFSFGLASVLVAALAAGLDLRRALPPDLVRAPPRQSGHGARIEFPLELEDADLDPASTRIAA